MFSVNVDKLIKTTEQEHECYKEAASNTLSMVDANTKSIAVIGDGIVAFKLATALMANNKKVLFVDGYLKNEVFLSKYKLGKNLKGVTDYLQGGLTLKEIMCITNQSGLHIVFTGNVPAAELEINKEKFQSFFEAAAEYDIILMLTDGKSELPAYCDGTIIMVPDAQYSEETAASMTKQLEEKGCTVLGTIVHE